MEWNEMIELLLNSIQIIGVFIAIILGLVISKVMELKKEKSELLDFIEEIGIELNHLRNKFDKLKKENYEFYKEDNVISVIDSIFDGEEFEISNSIPYISEQEQRDYYNYVKEFIFQVIKMIQMGDSLEECKRMLKVEKYSVEDIIIDETYERRR